MELLDHQTGIKQADQYVGYARSQTPGIHHRVQQIAAGGQRAPVQDDDVLIAALLVRFEDHWDAAHVQRFVVAVHIQDCVLDRPEFGVLQDLIGFIQLVRLGIVVRVAGGGN